MPDSPPLQVPPSLTPVATYRLQLRDGVDFAAARNLLPWLKTLRVSHLYLSPLLTAAQGSSHGYDVANPDEVDPALGGQSGFEALAQAAHAAGIGLVLDIVPNHMAFTPQNPLLADVLRHGLESGHAKIFDIDWDRGRLHAPVLDRPAADLLDTGQIAIAGTSTDPRLSVYDESWPLNPTPLATALVNRERPLDAATLEDLLAQQHWSLGHWRETADRIIHRRFFNVTGLIGVRQEDPAVFESTHRWLLDQVAAGRVQGVRVDHIDGLARPGGYLHRLRSALDTVSPAPIPIWIEKIVKADESLPPWPVTGMSGYEFIAPLTRLLLPAPGLAALRKAAGGAVPEDYAEAVREVRRDLLTTMFAPERARVLAAARTALAADGDDGAGLAARHDDALLADALDALACDWPVYRSYTADGCPPASGPQAVLSRHTGHGAMLLADLLHAPDDPPARTFAARFEQLTGALTAKSEEDTLFYHAVACLALCEVGAEPDLDTLDADAFATLMQNRATQTPMALSTLSTHDTKRSVDARAALIALAWRPALATRLYGEARTRAVKAGLPEGLGLYALQTALAMRGAHAAESRISAHVAKALREGKALSSHEEPDEETEARAAELCLGMLADLERDRLWSSKDAADFDAAREAVVLAQVAFQITAPGIPDLYRGSEVEHVALTDPDNRHPVDHAAIAGMAGDESTLSGRKLALTRHLLARRAHDPDLYARGDYALEESATHWTVTRRYGGRGETIRIPKPAAEPLHAMDKGDDWLAVESGDVISGADGPAAVPGL